MAGKDDVTVKIGADTEGLKKGLGDSGKAIGGLSKELSSVFGIGALSFAGLVTAVGKSVQAFFEAEAASKKLGLALQSQGIYTKELADSYGDIAKEISNKTGLDDDEITAAQAKIQGFIGQTKVTKELTEGIANLAAVQGGDLLSATDEIARALNGSSRELKKYGIEIDATLPRSERLKQVTEALNKGAFGGQAEAAGKAFGGIQGLKTAFGDLAEVVGSLFAPLVTESIEGFTIMAKASTEFLKSIFESEKAAEVFAFLRNVFNGFSTYIAESFLGVGKVIVGVFSFDKGLLLEGIDGIRNSVKNGIAVFNADLASESKKAEEIQSESLKRIADKRAAQQLENDNILIRQTKANLSLQTLELQNASAIQIDLKKKEIQLLGQIEKEKNDQIKTLLKQRLLENDIEQIKNNENELQRIKEFDALKLETKFQLDAEEQAYRTDLNDKQITELRAQKQTEQDVEKKAFADRLAATIEADNKLLENKKKYGLAYATLYNAVNSSELNATNAAAGQLVALSQSKNATLKGIGKAAAVTQIGIDSAKGAVAVYANFQTAIPFPPVSIPLGIGAAAAILAFGAERIGQVTAAADGGLITGGIPGKDSVPSLLTPGELVVPAQNFDQVVGAIKRDRTQEPTQGGGIAEIILNFTGEMGQFIEAKLNEQTALGLSIRTS